MIFGKLACRASQVRRPGALVGLVMAGAIVTTACTPVVAAGQGGPANKGAIAHPATTNPIGSVGARSGLSWNSGIWPVDRSGSDASYNSTLQYAENKRGRKSDVNMAAQYNGTWGDLTGMQILDFLDATPSSTSVVMLPPFPSGGTWSAAAAGSYDAYYRQIGAAIAAKRPNAKTVVRLAWEANGDWYPWSIVSNGGAATFIAGWRRAVDNLRAGAGSKASNIVIDYSLAALDDKGQGDPLTVTYPGDAYVDLIGIDIYDSWYVTTSPTTPGYGAQMNRAYSFAVAHGKWLSIDEWGLHHTDAGAPEGKDNPKFISAMLTWIKSHKSRLAYEQYFQDDAQDNVNSSLFSPDRNSNPVSSAEYKALYSSS